MRFDALRHIRDHSKTTGLPRLLLFEIGTHLNYHTGEAFLLSVDRLAHPLGVTPQWTRQLLHGLIAAGELEVARSRGRHAHVYRIPYERCPACQGTQERPSSPPEANPQLEYRDDFNPKLETPEPETPAPPTLNSEPPNPKVASTSAPPLARIQPLKDLYKERKIFKDGPRAWGRDRWQGKTCGRDGCDLPQCPHWQQCAEHACCKDCATAPASA